MQVAAWGLRYVNDRSTVSLDTLHVHPALNVSGAMSLGAGMRDNVPPDEARDPST